MTFKPLLIHLCTPHGTALLMHQLKTMFFVQMAGSV